MSTPTLRLLTALVMSYLGFLSAAQCGAVTPSMIRSLQLLVLTRSQTIANQKMATGTARPANRSTDAARNWTTIKPGDRVSGLTITLAEGAASIHGQIKSAENQKLLARLFVYLVPAEREKAEDVLRFFASLVSTDGSFALNNLPSGSYWAIARPAGETYSRSGVFRIRQKTARNYARKLKPLKLQSN